jgi:hypothetical protein
MSKEYDLFVSHSHLDTSRVRDLVKQWQNWNHRIFADFNDPKLVEASRKQKMDSETSEHLRRAIGKCAVFIFIASANSAVSRWMPWELGLAHGMVGRVHLYLLDDTAPKAFRQREYLELYKRRCFDHTTAEVYLRKVVDQARSEPTDPAQIEKGLYMGQEIAQAAREFDIVGMSELLIDSPLEQRNATVEGISGELPSESNFSQSNQLWNARTSTNSRPKKSRT